MGVCLRGGGGAATAGAGEDVGAVVGASWMVRRGLGVGLRDG